MSMGSLNILKHKSWHVWNKDNLARIEKDEENHKKEQQRIEKRKLGIEQEKRYSQLKNRLKKQNEEEEEKEESETRSSKKQRIEESDEEDEDAYFKAVQKRQRELEQQNLQNEEETKTTFIPSFSSASSGLGSGKHINFFEEIEKQEPKGTSLKEIGFGNPEYEQEKKAKENQFTQYLGSGSAELAKSKPWYYDSQSSVKARSSSNLLKTEKKKLEEDPLAVMNKYINKKKEIEKKKKDKKKPSSSKSVEQLRKERIEREKQEQQKIQKILSSSK